MKPSVVAGLVLVLLGIVALIYRQNYREEKALFEVGSFRASIDREKTWSPPTAVGIVALAAGGVLIAIGLKKR